MKYVMRCQLFQISFSSAGSCFPILNQTIQLKLQKTESILTAIVLRFLISRQFCDNRDGGDIDSLQNSLNYSYNCNKDDVFFLNLN